MLLAVVVFLGSLAIGVALPQRAAGTINVTIGGPTYGSYAIWGEAAFLDCDVNANTGAATAYIAPADGYTYRWAYWYAHVWHYFPSNPIGQQFYHGGITEQFIFDPSEVSDVGGFGRWQRWPDLANIGTTRVAAYANAWVAIQAYLYDAAATGDGWVYKGNTYWCHVIDRY
jgi:hypothetical protein